MPVIEQAKGVLMAQQRCGPDEAFDLLRRASQRANVKVRFLAALIVEQISSQSAGPGAVPAKPAAVASYDSQPGIRRLNGQSPVPGDGG